MCAGNEDFIVHFFYGEYNILKEHDFKNRKNNKSKPFKKNYFERSNNNEHRGKKKFRFKKHSRRGSNRAF